MQLSNSSLLKQTRIENTAESKIILTQRPIVQHPVIDEVPAQAAAISLEKTEEHKIILEKERIEQLNKIEQLKQKILQSAHEEAEEIKKQVHEKAYAKAYEKGQTEGFEEGRNQGFQQGMAESAERAQQLLQQAKNDAKEILASIAVYRKEKQEEVVAFGIEIAQNLINQRFETDTAALMDFLRPVLLRFEKPDQFLTLRIHPDHKAQLTELLEEKKEELINFRYLILVDSEMPKSDFTIESDETFVSFDLTEEIKLFLKQLQEIEKEDDFFDGNSTL